MTIKFVPSESWKSQRNLWVGQTLVMLATKKPPLLTHVVEPDGDVVVDGVEGGDDHGQQDLGAEPQELGVTLGANGQCING